MLNQSSVSLVMKLTRIVLAPHGTHEAKGAVPAFLHSSGGESHTQMLRSGSWPRLRWATWWW